jgi:hypothetical protein
LKVIVAGDVTLEKSITGDTTDDELSDATARLLYLSEAAPVANAVVDLANPLLTVPSYRQFFVASDVFCGKAAISNPSTTGETRAGVDVLIIM